MTVDVALNDVLEELCSAGVDCAEECAALCHARAHEISALSVPVSVALVKHGISATITALATSVASDGDAVDTCRALLACAPLGETARRASRLTSLATFAIESAIEIEDERAADAAACRMLRLLQEAGVDVIAPGALDQDSMPLVAACMQPLLRTAELLVHLGADPSQRTRDGKMWPLLAAAGVCADATMELLLAKGASLTTQDNKDATIVCHLAKSVPVLASTAPDAAADGKFEARWLRRMIAAKPALLEIPDSNGLTPLMAAAGLGHMEAVEALLGLGARLDAVTPEGTSALGAACASFRLPVVCRLLDALGAAGLLRGWPHAAGDLCHALQGAGAMESGCGQCESSCGGALEGNCADALTILQSVLAAGLRASRDADGRSLTRILIKFCTDGVQNISSNDQGHAITCSEAHALSLLQTLRAAGVDVLDRGGSGPPTLHRAVSRGLSVLARWLVTVAGAPLEERDESGYTPLLRACYEQRYRCAHTLLDCGARVDVQSTDGEGWWPVLLAVSEPDGELVRRMAAADPDTLLRALPRGSNAIHLAVEVWNDDALRLLLRSGLPHLQTALNATTRDRDARPATPLHLACAIENWPAATALLAAGARVDVVGHVGEGRAETIAEWACSRCSHRGVKASVAARARQHAADARAAAPGAGAGAAVAAAAHAGAGEAAEGTGAASEVPPAAEALLTAAGPLASTGRAPSSGSVAKPSCAVASAGSGAGASAGKRSAAGSAASSPAKKAGRGRANGAAARNRAEECSDALEPEPPRRAGDALRRHNGAGSPLVDAGAAVDGGSNRTGASGAAALPGRSVAQLTSAASAGCAGIDGTAVAIPPQSLEVAGWPLGAVSEPVAAELNLAEELGPVAPPLSLLNLAEEPAPAAVASVPGQLNLAEEPAGLMERELAGDA
jgi:ankyrin repeat protein